ncbi:MAG: SpoIIE family protein phosphatase, partial [Anaerolineae bacterium]|nr:SpoIIE family protein phosphatase [Anaerolineae bacterium]
TTITSEVVRSRQALLTNNAQFDERYQAGQSIILRGLRAILCAPMMVKDRLIGIIYVDTSMRKGNFTPADRDLMAAVAGQAAVALENARLYSLAVEQGRLMHELQMAREIQQSLLPQHMPTVSGYQMAAYWQAAREVAGDFYDVFALDAERFAVAIADVSDKGAPAAMFMAVARTMIRTLAHTGLSALQTVARTNDMILEDAESGMFVTVYYSVFERGGQSVHVNAGHNPIVIYRSAEKSAFLMPRGGRAIGWFPDNPLTMRELELVPGDLVIFYTDGLTEAENAIGDFFGEERLMKTVVENAHHSAEGVLSAILSAAAAFCGAVAPFDDQTIVVVRYDG